MHSTFEGWEPDGDGVGRSKWGVGLKPDGDRTSGPILSALGLGAWAIVIVANWWLWGGYQTETDPVGIIMIAGAIVSFALILAGGAAGTTLSAVGLMMSLTKLLRSKRWIPWEAAGVALGALGIGPMAFVAFRLVFG